MALMQVRHKVRTFRVLFVYGSSSSPSPSAFQPRSSFPAGGQLVHCQPVAPSSRGRGPRPSPAPCHNSRESSFVSPSSFVLPSLQVGNSYTASLWHGLASLLYRRGAGLAGRRLLLYSFGSGTVAALFSLVGAQGTSPAQPADGGCEGEGEDGGRGGDSRFSLGAMQRALALDERLACRAIRTVEQYNAAAETMEALNGSVAPYCPTGGLEGLAGGTYYLEGIDGERRRWYVRKEK